MMRLGRLLFLIPLLSLADAVCIQAQSPKGKLFIIGGGDKPPEMIKRIIEESALAEGDYALILPMASTEPDSSFYYAKTLFNDAGLYHIYRLSCNRDDANSIVKADSIRGASLIYLTGGDQSLFMDIVDGSAVEKAIREAYLKGALVAGTSAGAAMMSKVMITGNQIKYATYMSTFKVIESGNTETRPGLGLLPDIIIDQHFLVRSRHNRLITAVLQYPGMKGIGIDEATAILVNGKRAEVIGLSQVLVYSHSSGKVVNRNEKLGGVSLKLDIFLPGDSFKL